MFLNAYMIGSLDINLNLNVVEYDVNPYHWNAVAPYALDKMSQDSAVFLRPAVILHILIRSPIRPVMIKTHSANIVMDGITFFPRKLSGGAVYIVRDPRDVCVSLARHRGKTINETIAMMESNEGFLVHDGTEGIFSVLGSWSRNVSTWQREWVTTIRYEDLLANPEEQFKKVLTAYGIKVNRPRLRKAIRLCELSRLMAQEKKNGFIERMEQEKFFGQGKGWRTELTERQARSIESDHSEMMGKFGYL